MGFEAAEIQGNSIKVTGEGRQEWGAVNEPIWSRSVRAESCSVARKNQSLSRKKTQKERGMGKIGNRKKVEKQFARRGQRRQERQVITIAQQDKLKGRG